MKHSQFQKKKRLLNKVFSRLTPFLILVVLVLTYILLVNKLQIFAVDDIQVDGTKTFVSKTDVMELVKARVYGKNLLYLETDDLEQSIKDTFQGAKEVKVTKHFLNGISVDITEREPVAVVYNKNTSNQFLVDEDGYVLGVVAPGSTSFPKIIYEGDIEVGYFLDAGALGVYFSLLNALEDDGVAVSSASVQRGYLVVFLRNSIEVLVSSKKDVYESARTLSRLLQQLSTMGKSATRVDLRYDKVVVSYD